MAVYRPSQARQQKGQTAPQEPNLIPIMNLFLTIIPFLLLMVTISQVALVALNFSSDGGGGGDGGGDGGGGDKAKQIEIHLMLTDNQALGLFPGMEIREPGTDTVRLPWVSENIYDFDGLNTLLKTMKERNTSTEEISIVAHNDVIYDTLIRTIDLCKDNGFSTVHYKSPRSTYYY